MKTMTCRQMGGPCDLGFQGITADEVIKAQDAHLKDMAENHDEAHQPAQDAMAARWSDPKGGMEWYQKVKEDFAALPDDES